MKNWKIGTRISTGFGVVIVIAVTLGAFAYNRVGTIETKSARITGKTLPGLYYVGQVQSNMHKCFALLLEHVESENSAAMASAEAEMATLRSRSSSALQEYEKTIMTEKGRSLFENLGSLRGSYWSTFEQVLRLSKAGKKKEARDGSNERTEASGAEILRRLRRLG